jgi:hypothetical protein
MNASQTATKLRFLGARGNSEWLVAYWDKATIRDKVGHLETLPIDLLYAHLDASFIFNHLDL